MKNIKIYRRLGAFLLACFASITIANAAIIYDFSSPIQAKEQIQYYFSGQASGANQAGNFINLDTTIVLVSTDPQKYAKSLKPLPSDQFTFGSWDDVAGSSTLLLRVWDKAAQTPGGSYTSLSSRGNSSGQTDELAFPITYAYIYATPTKATITQYSEVGTTVINPLSVSKTVTFSSRSDAVSGKTVEIAGSKWVVKQGPTTVPLDGSGTNLTLDSTKPPTGITMNTGDSLSLQVQHINLWGDIGPLSDAYTYTVGAGAGVGGASISKIYTITPVINTFSLPFDCSKPLTYQVGANAAVPMASGMKVRDLLNAVGNVSVFGWYDSVNKKQEGFTSVNSTALDSSTLVPNSSFTGSTAVTDLLNSTLVMDRPYQISILGGSVTSVTITITGTR